MIAHMYSCFARKNPGDRDEVDRRDKGDKGDKPRWGSPEWTEWTPVLVAFTGVFFLNLQVGTPKLVGRSWTTLQEIREYPFRTALLSR